MNTKLISSSSGMLSLSPRAPAFFHHHRKIAACKALRRQDASPSAIHSSALKNQRILPLLSELVDVQASSMVPVSVKDLPSPTKSIGSQ